MILMRKLLTIFFFQFSICAIAQLPDVQGYQVINGDTFDIKGYKRIPKPVEPPPPASTCSTKGVRRYLMPASWGGVYIRSDQYPVNPGDTIVIKGAWVGGVDMESYHGTATCPIVIINEG